MAFLYQNYKGFPVTAHSYSAGAEFSDCARKYDYSRRKGWKEKEKRASSQFGTSFEASLMYFHNSGLNLEEAIDEWKRLWLEFQNDTTLTYSDKDGDWRTMYQQGVDMLRLYAVKLPSLPIINPEFQLNYKKELFPDTEYAGLEYTAFVDARTEVPWDHPMLPVVEACPENGQRPLIIDIKTSAATFPTDPRMVRMDPQLRMYSWVSGIETVSFLVFQRRGVVFEKGDTVSLLIDASENHPAGSDMVVLSVDEDSQGAALVSEEIFKQYKEESKGLKGNAAKEKIAEFADRFSYLVVAEDFTKQRIQFLAVLISDQEREETGRVAGEQAIAICNASSEDFFPQRPGVRFPNNHCTWCSYLGLCLGDDKMVEEKLVQIGNVNQPAAEEMDWFEEL